MNLLKQTDKPLYPDILWSRPQNRKQAGRLVVIGGRKEAFNNVASSFEGAGKAGAGEIKAILPRSLQPILEPMSRDFVFVDSTSIGEIAKSAEAEMLLYVAAADGVLLPGDLGRNSETASVITNILLKSEKQITLSGDAIEVVIPDINFLLKRYNTCLVASFAQLQKIFKTARHHKAIVSDMSTQKLAEVLSEFTKDHAVIIVTTHNNQIFVAYKDRVSITRSSKETADWQTQTAGYTSVFWLQNPSKPFEAITSAVFNFTNDVQF